MVPTSARLHRAVVEKKLIVPDDNELRQQAANTIARHSRRGWNLDKPSLDLPNDSIIALAIGGEPARAGAGGRMAMSRAARDCASGVPDDFADFDAVDRHGGAGWRIRPNHLRPSSRRLFRFENHHASTTIPVQVRPVAGDESRRLADPGNALLVQDLLGLLEIVNRGLRHYRVH